MGALDGKVALITGASRGLGYAAAVELASAGAHIVAVAQTAGGLDELADVVETSGGTITLVPLDITDDGGVQRMCLALHERWGGCDLWLHTAIQDAPMAPAPSIGPKDLEKALSVNVTATARLIRMVEPLLVAREDALAVFFRDEKAGQSFFGTYGATKAAQIALFESWKAETRRISPKVLSFTPAPMPTALRARFFPGENKAALTRTETEAKRLLDAILGAQQPQ